MAENDEALMRAVRDGDLARLGILFDRYHVTLFDFLNRTTVSPSAKGFAVLRFTRSTRSLRRSCRWR